MRNRRNLRRHHQAPGFAGACALAAAICAAATSPVNADEGMWLVSKPPLATMKAKYGFEPSPEWMKHQMMSAVDPDSSGAFVSPQGLVMTNHHVASTSIEQVSTATNNYLRDGFYAPTLAEEIKLPELEVTMLVSTEDVTAKVMHGIDPADSSAAGAAKRRQAIAAIEAAEAAATGLQCRVVVLYQGGQYHVYRTKRFTDVRLVFSPELQAAFYGGDVANFEFPRFDFDVTFLRVYENGKPYRPEHHLTWSREGAIEGELALVFGHPGRTQRSLTMDHLRFVRDVDQPATLAHLWRAEKKMEAFAGRNAENARVASDELFGLANSRKARTGMLAGLHDPALMGAKEATEQALRGAVENNPALKARAGEAWEKVAKAYAAYRPWHKRHFTVTRALRPSIAGTAVSLALMTEDLAKPSSERLREFADSELPTTRLGLLSPAPRSAAFETAKLASVLSEFAEAFGAGDPLVVAALDGKSPQARAEQAIAGTTLLDHAARTQLVDGGVPAFKASTDPLVRLALTIAPEYRTLRKRFEDEVESVERASYAQIAAARFAIDGDRVYPDATGTLRMSFGPVMGYEAEGEKIGPFTDVRGLFAKAAERPGDKEFILPKRWVEARDRLNPSTPFNFVCACDIIGGNSGSPVVNTKGELIGLIFDGNIQSLPGAYAYDERVNRAVAVDSRILIEGLRVVYGAGALADEIMGRK
ncbi:MAG: S46 family peptidase [Phycisphaerales bacterium]